MTIRTIFNTIINYDLTSIMLIFFSGLICIYLLFLLLKVGIAKDERDEMICRRALAWGHDEDIVYDSESKRWAMTFVMDGRTIYCTYLTKTGAEFSLKRMSKIREGRSAEEYAKYVKNKKIQVKMRK